MTQPLILYTGHQIANTVARAFADWLKEPPVHVDKVTDDMLKDASFVIGYGILRGTHKVFERAEEMGKPWFIVDRGYFNPRHFDGNYRIGYKCTQVGWTEKDYTSHREMVFANWVGPQGKTLLICPPTEHVCQFYKVNRQKWLDEAINYADDHGMEALIRDKDCERDLNDDLKHTGAVYTFNSSIAWQAISVGIPAISDPQHSTVGRWQSAFHGGRKHDLIKPHARALIGHLLKHQWTLQEIAEGKAKAYVGGFL